MWTRSTAPQLAHGYPVFCVSMGLEWEGQLVPALFTTHSRRTVCRGKGSGATLNGGLSTSRPPHSGRIHPRHGFPSFKRHRIRTSTSITRLRCARTPPSRGFGCADLPTSRGPLRRLLEFNLNLDTAAGVCWCRKPRHVSRFDGSPFHIDSRETLASNTLITRNCWRTSRIFAGRPGSAPPSPALAAEAGRSGSTNPAVFCYNQGLERLFLQRQEKVSETLWHT